MYYLSFLSRNLHSLILVRPQIPSNVPPLQVAPGGPSAHDITQWCDPSLYGKYNIGFDSFWPNPYPSSSAIESTAHS